MTQKLLASPAQNLRRPMPRAFVAINAHPFHDLSELSNLIDSVKKAVDHYRRHSSKRIKCVFFWHNSAPIDHALKAEIVHAGYDIKHYQHASNGENLNAQISHAVEAGSDIFFRVDADDLVAENRFTLQSEAISSNLCDMCGMSLRYIPDKGESFITQPPARPTARDFLENAFVLHPTLAIKLSALLNCGLLYSAARLEDKALYLDAVSSGLRILNLDTLGGHYRVATNTRSALHLKLRNLRLNLIFLVRTRQVKLLPYALVLFTAQILISPGKLRFFRSLLYARRRRHTGRAWIQEITRAFKPKLINFRLF